MYKKIEIIRILNNILIVYAVSSVFFIALKMPMETALFAGNLSLVAFVVATEVISAFCSNFILFVAMHVIAGAGSLTLAKVLSSGDIEASFIGGIQVDSVYMALRIFVMIVVMVVSIYSRLDEKPRYTPEIAEGFLFVGLFVLCLISKKPEAIVIVLISEMIWAVLCIIFYNTRQAITFLLPFKERDYVPYQAIGRTNGLMLRICIFIATIFMLACAFLDYGKEIVAFLKRILIAVLSFIFSFFNFDYENEYVAPEEVQSGGFGSMLPEIEEDNSILHAIWEALYWIIAVAVGILIIVLAIKAVKEFYKLFNSSKKGIKERLSRDKIEFLNPLSFGENVAGRKDKSKMTVWERLSPSGRVRLLFVKYVESGMHLKEPVKSDSPRQMEERAFSEKNAVAYTLYEKARYSSQVVTSEDVKKMKSFTS
nr:hypothetical protein [uncultured Butyrivibrio sp.]